MAAISGAAAHLEILLFLAGPRYPMQAGWMLCTSAYRQEQCSKLRGLNGSP
jgi:hypothetical protein